MEFEKSIRRDFIKRLMLPEAYNHPVGKIKLIETHLSWVILTGQYAYKIKKRLKSEIINTLSLEARRDYCNEEIRLNRRLSKNIYITLCSIIIENNNIRLLEKIEINNYVNELDVAIKMKQFDQNMILKNHMTLNNINYDSLIKFSVKLARFHTEAKRCKLNDKYGEPSSILKYSRSNLDCLMNAKLNKEINEWISLKNKSLEKDLNNLKPIFKERKSLGFIRECHGDLHIGNIIVNEKGEFEAIDSLDFNADLRWIDPICDIAFMVTGLNANQIKSAGAIVINNWLEITGDYLSLKLWKWYYQYACLVRAKVLSIYLERSCLYFENNHKEKVNFKKDIQEIKTYISMSKDLDLKKNAYIILMHGLSGSGKSYISEKLSRELNAVRIRSDSVRYRIFKNKSGPERDKLIKDLKNKYIKENILYIEPYSKLFNEWMFFEFFPSVTKSCVSNNIKIILDATYLRFKEREVIYNISKEYKVPYIILNCECSDDIAEERIEKREEIGGDRSEANMKTRIKQKSYLEPLEESEKLFRVEYNTNKSSEALAVEIKTKISYQNKSYHNI